MRGGLQTEHLCAAYMAIMSLAGWMHPVGTFGRWVAPYTFAGTVTLIMCIVIDALGAIWRDSL